MMEKPRTAEFDFYCNFKIFIHIYNSYIIRNAYNYRNKQNHTRAQVMYAEIAEIKIH